MMMVLENALKSSHAQEFPRRRARRPCRQLVYWRRDWHLPEVLISGGRYASRLPRVRM